MDKVLWVRAIVNATEFLVGLKIGRYIGNRLADLLYGDDDEKDL